MFATDDSAPLDWNLQRRLHIGNVFNALDTSLISSSTTKDMQFRRLHNLAARLEARISELDFYLTNSYNLSHLELC